MVRGGNMVAGGKKRGRGQVTLYIEFGLRSDDIIYLKIDACTELNLTQWLVPKHGKHVH